MLNFLIHASTQSLASSLGQRDLLVQTIRTALTFALIVGCLSALGIWLCREFFYSLLAVNPTELEQVESYLKARVIGHPLTLLAITSLSLLRGLKALKSSLYLVIWGCLINILGTAAGLWLFQGDLSVVGAATVLSHGVVFVLTMIKLLKVGQIEFSELWGKLNLESCVSFGEKSWHLLGRSVALASCFFVATRVASILGPLELAAHQVALQFWLAVAYLTDGLAMSATILIAEGRSKKDYGSVKRTIDQLCLICFVLGLCFMLTYLLFDSQMMTIFTPEEEIHEALSALWWVLSFGQIYLCLTYLFDGVLFGAQYYRYVKYLMLVSVGIGFLPLAYYAQMQGELVYLWLGLAMVGLIRFFAGGWATWKIRNEV